MTVVNEPTLCVASRGFLSASLKASASARLNLLRHFDPISPTRGPTLASRRFDQLRCLAMVALATLVVVSASGGTPITRDFVFDNFDGARAELRLSIDERVFLDSVVDTTAFTAAGLSADQNYIAIVKGLFAQGKPRMRFVFDAFSKALPNVSESYFLQTLVAFVQSPRSLPYGIPPMKYRGVNTDELFPPIIALVEGYGDCDTRSLLFACIASHRFKVIFLVGSTHAFVGVAVASPAKGEEFVEISGRKFVLFETTAPWGFGVLPASSRSDINKGKYYYIELE
jgi:hypothetical protein